MDGYDRYNELIHVHIYILTDILEFNHSGGSTRERGNKHKPRKFLLFQLNAI